MSKKFGAALAFLVLLLATPWLSGQETPRETVRLRLVGANPSARAMPLTDLPEPSHFFLRDKPDATPEQRLSLARAWYHDVYPGIDLLCYDNGYDMEYVFILSPGADPSLIRIAYEGPKNFSITQTGSILMPIQGGEIVQSPPVAFVKTDDSKRATDSLYDIGFGGVVSIHLPKVRAAQAARFNGSTFNLIPRGGQPGGPLYNYYLSKFEITQGQYLRFLNDAEANTSNPRGSFMFFDSQGNVWIHPRKKRDRDELFTLSNSRLTYTPSKPAGARYDHRRTADGSTPFASHPASGVSWYGAVKYCNWLTVESGRTPAECAYKEGTNALGWMPVTATNWANGYFGDAERDLWLSVKGFRLPMVNASTPVLTTNSYNEFYKASAWFGFTNRLYGFGRDLFDGTDANCRETIGLKKPTPLPVGFFNGEGLLGKIRTRANGNLYGIFDLTGNANEWMSDFAVRSDPGTRLLCGGSWNRSLKPISAAEAVPPCSTDIFSGFRSTTTYMPSEVVIIHILYSFFMEPGAAAAATLKEGGAIGMEKPPPEEAGVGLGERLEATPNEITQNGTTYKSPTETEVTPGGGTPEGGGPGEPPPPIGTVTNTLIVESLTPNTGVPITITPDDVTGSGDGVTPSITRRYLQNTVVQLTAPATADGNSFVRWLRNGVNYSVNPSVNVTMSSDITMTAVYAGPRTLTVESSNPDSGVNITVTPNDRNGNGNGSTTFNRIYNDGTSVTLTAPATASGNDFVQWLRNGVPYAATPTVSVTMDSDITMTVVYTPSPIVRTLIVRSSNPGSGVSIFVSNDNNGDGTGNTTFTRLYNDGTVITLIAPLFAGGNRFLEWQRDGVFFSSLRVTNLTMDNNYTMMAIYVYDPVIIPDPDASNGGI